MKARDRTNLSVRGLPQSPPSPAGKLSHPSSQMKPSSSQRCLPADSPAPRSHPRSTLPSAPRFAHPNPTASPHSTYPPATPPPASSHTPPLIPVPAPAFHAETVRHRFPPQTEPQPSSAS